MIERNIDLGLLKNTKVAIVTPMYGGSAFAGYVHSLMELTAICTKNNISLDFLCVWNESLITRGRNNLVHNFLKTDNEYLFFVDADIVFNPFDFLYMLQLAKLDKEKQIICGAYPIKTINWDFIRKAEERGFVKNKEDYSQYQSSYVVNLTEVSSTKTVPFNPDEPLKVYQSGTGFMLIAKNVFLKFKEKYPEQKYVDKGLNDFGDWEDGEEKVAFFDCKINKKTKQYMSEDWMFCDYTNKIGISTWVLPWVSLNHFGTYEYKGNFKNYSEQYKKLH